MAFIGILSQSRRGERPPRRFGRDDGVTNGVSSVTNGRASWPSWLIAYAAIAAIAVLVGVINVLTVLHDSGRDGDPLPVWEPATWEGTSGIVIVGLAWIPMLMVRRFPPAGRGWAVALAAHLAATVAFSLIHIAAMVLLRHGVYALMGETYDFGPAASELPYEYRKDFLTYCLFGATFWIAGHLGRAPVVPSPPAAPPRDTFDINEGQRLIRVDRADILSVQSRGNYVEFTLADGRQPLMRATLASIAQTLDDAGFLRTHRSWLVNARHVTEIVPAGSGDHELVLSNGAAVPLSRRQPEALARLRASGIRKPVDF